MTDKSFPQPSSPHTPNRRFTRYSLVWAGAALISLLYLVMLAAQPALVAGMLGASTEPTEVSATQKALDATVAEVGSLRDSMEFFRNELAEVRAQVSNQSDVTRELTTRLSTLEAQAAEPAKVAEAELKAKDTKKAKEAKEAKEAPTKEAAAKKAPAKREIETGSVAQQSANAPITFGPPVVTPAATPPAPSQIGVQIATGPSVDSLRLSWTLLNERHGTTLSSLEPRYTTGGSGSDRSYDLVVGPVASADEARRLCQELSLRATPCTVSRFTGDAL